MIEGESGRKKGSDPVPSLFHFHEAPRLARTHMYAIMGWRGATKDRCFASGGFLVLPPLVQGNRTWYGAAGEGEPLVQMNRYADLNRDLWDREDPTRLQRFRFASRYLGYNRISEVLALAALDSTEYYHDMNAKLVGDRKRYYAFFDTLDGYRCFRSNANFVLVRLVAGEVMNQ